ncbi:MAG: VOC family protein [Acidobacteriota bacterium]
MSLTPFHLAFPVSDLDATRRFYTEVLGCREGRSAERWVDFDFHGHQISAHLRAGGMVAGGGAAGGGPGDVASNPVDGDTVPIPHFGLVLSMDNWEKVAERVRGQGVEFIIGPRIRFQGEPGEQGTFFVRDPSGNAIEIKGFRDEAMIFAT